MENKEFNLIRKVAQFMSFEIDQKNYIKRYNAYWESYEPFTDFKQFGELEAEFCNRENIDTFGGGFTIPEGGYYWEYVSGGGTTFNGAGFTPQSARVNTLKTYFMEKK